MNKEQWEALYKLIESAYSSFQEYYSDSKNGKNAKIRAKASREVESAIDRADRHISGNPEALGLFTVFNSNPFAYDEFLQARYFNNDMKAYLRTMQEKIASFDDTEARID